MGSSPARRRIKDAYLELLAESPQGPITVTQIAQRAHVNRVTFYRLFETQEAVLLDILDEFDKATLEKMPEVGTSYEDSSSIVGELMEHHRQNMPMLRTVLGSSMAPILEQRIGDGVRNPVRGYLNRSLDPTLSGEMFLSFYVAGITRVVCDWIRGGCKESIDDMLGFFKSASVLLEQ